MTGETNVIIPFYIFDVTPFIKINHFNKLIYKLFSYSHTFYILKCSIKIWINIWKLKALK